MRRRVGTALTGRARAAMAAVLAMAVAFGLAAGVALAAEDDAAAKQDAKQQSTAKSQEAAQDGDAKVEPTSEVVTSYYHDAWYEASLDDGSDKDGKDDEADGDADADDADAQPAEAAEGQEQTDDGLDPALNDLGEENAINLQQTPDGTFLYDTRIYDLVRADQTFQNTVVQVKGEAVGDAIRAGGGKYWITLDATREEASDGKEGSISVLVDESVIHLIDTYGGYDKTGTVLRVKGTFYLACSSHEGIMDLHADTVSVVAQGQTTSDELNVHRFVPGMVLCGIGLVLTIVYRVLSERQR